MGIVDEFKRWARGEDDEDFEYEDEMNEYAPKQREKSFNNIDKTPMSAGENKIVNIHATTQLAVVLVKPDKFENASEIADHLKERKTVVLNLEQTHKDVARRLVDFLSGVAYANEGKIKKVANSTYIITPFNVDLLGDLIDELENNGLYM